MNTASMGMQQALSADPSSLNGLKYQATKSGDEGKAALKQAAKQFEALFMREVIKSMREATMKSGMLEGQGSNLGNDLLDQQFATQMSGLPGGLSSAIERQLSQQITDQSGKGGATNAAPSAKMSEAPLIPGGSTVSRASGNSRQAGFVNQHSQAAEVVSRDSGIPASYMIGQAGHETGWGKSEIRHADGSPSFNLFGIKATGGWTGKVAEVRTTEYSGGSPHKTTAKFRAYDSYEDAFRDYAKLISKSPRYDQVMDQLDSVQGFTTGLQKAGYATDPRYAAKLSQAINTTLSLQRSSL